MSRGLTQAQLAESADISISHLSMIERGERVPHLFTLATLAAGLSARLRDLVDGCD